MSSWINKSPGDLSIELPEVTSGDVEAAVTRASKAFESWRSKSMDDRAAALKTAQALLTESKDELARGIALETGKPIKEAVGEVGAVIAKIDLAIADAGRYLDDETVTDSPHPNLIRKRPRGVAAVIGPFNFPIHLGHGAIAGYLMAGNTVVYKPSPLAANVCAKYGAIMSQALGDAFQLVQGGATEGQSLVTHPLVRSVCFTGSVAAGQSIAKSLAGDLSKDVALELGGKNATIVCADADIPSAAAAVAEAMCLTAGQRCNSTSRVIVDRAVEDSFIEEFRAKLHAYVPGDPMLETTRLGPLISAAAKERYFLTLRRRGDWIVPGGTPERVAGKRGHYVIPAALHLTSDAEQHTLFTEEVFAPILLIARSSSDDEAIRLANATPYGLTASVFTSDRDRFMRLADQLEVGNVYQNLPTTLSPSTLPFGGLKNSGNHHPGGRGFVRFASDEQVVQMKE